MSARRTILWRWCRTLIISEVILTTLASITIWYVAKNRTLEDAVDSLHRLTPVLAEHYAHNVLEHDSASLRTLVAEHASQLNQRITILDVTGTVLADSHADIATMENHADRLEIIQAARDGIGHSERFSKTLGHDHMYVAARVGSAASPQAFVRTSVSKQQIMESFKPIARSIIIFGFSLAILTASVALFISRSMTSEIRLIAAGAARFADGDLTHTLPTSSETELSAISRALNVMGVRLHTQMTELQTRREQERLILESMRDAVIALDDEQRILEMNKASTVLFGVAESEAKGRLIHEVIRQPQLHEFIETAMTSVRSGRVEFTMTGTQSAIVEARCAPLDRPNLQAPGLLLVMNDVTELRRLESLRSEFASNVSHELRTPITNLKGYAETLLDVGTSDPEQSARFISIIQQNAEQLDAIVEDILTLTRLEQPRSHTIELERRNIKPIAARVCDLFARQAAEKHVRLDNRIGDDITGAVYDRLLGQALGNLVANAVTYCPEHSTVVIDAVVDAAAGCLNISVTDEGPGIAAEHLPRLFERFYRVDKARSRAEGGTGLGLAIVKHIALAHGGRAEVESTQGNGSVFRLLLPFDGPEIAQAKPLTHPNDF